MAKTFTLSQVLAGLEINAPAATAGLTLDAQPGGQSQVLGQENELSRWSMLLGDTSPEVGSNAGSNFRLDAFKDNGTFLSTPISINRQTGVVTIPKLEITDPSGIHIEGGDPGNVLTTDGSGGIYWSDAGTVGEAPQDSQTYGRNDGGWVVSAIQHDTPPDGILYGRKDTLWEAIPASIPDAPHDGVTYGRTNSAWTIIPGGGIGDALKRVQPPMPAKAKLGRISLIPTSPIGLQPLRLTRW